MHRFDEHTGEIELVVEAPTLTALLEETALALAELMSTEIRPAEATIQTTVRASDRDALIVEWINELVYRSEIDKRVYAHAKVTLATETEITAELGGFEPPAIRTAVKAATMHNLAVRDTPSGLSARVVLDV
jgi:SHS2 domain-containing protein